MVWRLLWRTQALLVAVMVGCAGTPRFRVEETGRGTAVVSIPRAADMQPVVVEEEEFHQAVRRLARQVPLTGTPRQLTERTFQLDPLSGNYLYLNRDKKLVPTDPGVWDGTLTKEDLETAEHYRLWCRNVYGVYGDCLGGALVGGRYLDMQGRYMWALFLSKSPVLDELKNALGDMVNAQALLSSALWGVATVLFILVINPVAPALVAALGVGLILYMGYEPLYHLIAGWGQLMEDVKEASTFELIRDAGERFGKVLGRESARALVMLVLAALGQTAQGFAAKVPTLPGSALVAAQAESQAGIWLPAIGEVEELAVSAEAATVTVRATAVAMSARARPSQGPCVETHHIATRCNEEDTSRGGPWTPRFRKIFARAGMSLEDPANKMPLRGHYGPHPQRYHEIVYEELLKATKVCRSVVVCREKLREALQGLAREISTPGTELNQLVTQ